MAVFAQVVENLSVNDAGGVEIKFRVGDVNYPASGTSSYQPLDINGNPLLAGLVPVVYREGERQYPSTVRGISWDPDGTIHFYPDLYKGVEGEDIIIVSGEADSGLVAGGGSGGMVTADLVLDETPVGAVNGSNNIFTTLYDFIGGNVSVKINGLSQKKTTDYTTTGTRTITLLTAPAATDKVMVSYSRSADITIIFDEALAGLVNGTNQVFSTANAFQTGKVSISLNGLGQKLGTDYTIASSSSIQFTSAPQSGDQVTGTYVKL